MGEKGNSTVQDTVTIHGNIYMDSRVLAWDLHLRHKDILKKVRKYTMDSIESCYKDAQGKKRTSYLVSRDGFVLMVTSYAINPMSVYVSFIAMTRQNPLPVSIRSSQHFVMTSMKLV